MKGNDWELLLVLFGYIIQSTLLVFKLFNITKCRLKMQGLRVKSLETFIFVSEMDFPDFRQRQTMQEDFLTAASEIEKVHPIV
jgi:hypothetical protein